MAHDDERAGAKAQLERQQSGGIRQRVGLISWCLYDWANSAFSTIVATFVFPVYFTQMVARDPIQGATQWSYAVAGAALAVAIGAPALRRHRRQYGKAQAMAARLYASDARIHCRSLVGGARPTIRLTSASSVRRARHVVWFRDDFLRCNATQHRAFRLSRAPFWLGVGAGLCRRPPLSRRSVVWFAESSAAVIRSGGRASRTYSRNQSARLAMVRCLLNTDLHIHAGPTRHWLLGQSSRAKRNCRSGEQRA